MTSIPCTNCGELAFFSKKRSRMYCSECEHEFDAPSQAFSQQSIFLSYAHRSEREEDFDISEDLVWLIKEELEKDGHLVWIDHEGIRSGTQWRERITDAITSHKHFLAFLSKRSVRQDPNVCLNEVAIAIKHNRIIQTIMTEGENQVSPPLTLSSIQWHKFEDWKEIREAKKTGPQGENWETWFGNLMLGIRQSLADITHQKAVGELAELKAILNPTSFEASIINSVEGFYGRKWLFDATDKWLKSDSRVFWLKGSPGIGKSSYAAKLVHSGNSSIAGFFKCEFQSLKSAEDSASECIRTLAYQLASRLPDYRIKLLRGQQLDAEVVQKKTSDDLFTYLITEPLNRSEKIAESQRLALVIDALDEAGRLVGAKFENPLADLLYKHADQLPVWLGVIVTSRPEAYLQQQLGAKFAPLIIEGGTQQNLSDLKQYLETKLDPFITGELRDKTIDALIEKSGGTFLYIKRVEREYDLSRPEKLPNGLDDLFFRDFERYFPDPKVYGQWTEKFLRLLVAAPGPLPKKLAQEVLGWQSRDVTCHLTQPMFSLLAGNEEGLYFFHKSIKDWLQDGLRSGLFQVNTSGSKELGEFLWNVFRKGQFEGKNEESVLLNWQLQILNWLPELLSFTSVWEEIESLDQFSNYLHTKFKFQAELNIRRRQIELLKKSPNYPLQLAKSLYDFGVLLDTLGDYQNAKSVVTESLDIYSKNLGRLTEITASIINRLAEINFSMANFIEAEPLYREALSIRKSVLGNNHQETAQSMAYLAGLLQSISKFDEAQDLYQESLNVCERLLGNKHPDTVLYTTYLAGIYEEKGDYVQSEELYRKALSVNRFILNSNDPNLSLSIGYVGWALASKGDFIGAEEYYLEALKIQESILGTFHPYTARTMTYLGDLKIKQGKLTEAHSYHDKALKIREDTLGINHPDTARTLMSATWLIEISGENELVGHNYKQALSIFQKICGPAYPDTLNAINHLGAWFLRYKKDFTEASLLFQKSLEVHQHTLGHYHPYTLRTLAHNGELILASGDVDQATSIIKLVKEKRMEVLGEGHPDTSLARYCLSWIEENKDEFAKNTFLWKKMPNPNSLRLAVR